MARSKIANNVLNSIILQLFFGFHDFQNPYEISAQPLLKNGTFQNTLLFILNRSDVDRVCNVGEREGRQRSAKPEQRRLPFRPNGS
ncbi:hypothetical protein MRBLRC7O_004059 [Agrobacterium radiobacter]|uniref:hypothetical protein n=1 Tax=Agrobacterium radiobacter TaxID=362 RepID=UPI0013AF58D2